ncbi:MAG: DUF4870 domain-containing protein [Acidobacteria bacterium]|nr:DUF4870 domain-containing protein [Acidobacteriota bacterium]
MQNMSGGKTALGLDTNVGALICYVGNVVCMLGLIYSIVVLVTDKTNKLTRFHAMQSILLTATNLVILLPGYLIATAFFLMNSTVTSLLGTLLWLVIAIVGLAMFVLMIIAAIKGFNNEMYKIPVLGNFADKWSN